MEDIKKVSDGLKCKTEGDVQLVVDAIRKDIIPKIPNIQMGIGKVLFRKIFADPAESTKGGIHTIQNQKAAETAGVDYYTVHPNQAVICALGNSTNMQMSPTDDGMEDLKVGDHVITKFMDPLALQRNGVIIHGDLFVYGYASDIICVLNDTDGPAKSTSDTELKPRKSELPDKEKGHKK